MLPMDDAFQALWCWLICNADDAGRLHTDAAHIAHRRRRPVRIVEQRLGQMEERGMIARYEVKGKPYLALLNWSEHQYIDHPAKHVYPSPPDGTLASPREDSRVLAKSRPSRAPGPDRTRRDRTGPERTFNPPAPFEGVSDERNQKPSAAAEPEGYPPPSGPLAEVAQRIVERSRQGRGKAGQ